MEYGYEFTDSDKNYSDITPDYYSSSPISTLLTNNYSDGDDGSGSEIDNTDSENNLHLLVTSLIRNANSSDDNDDVIVSSTVASTSTTIYPWSITTPGIMMAPTTSDKNLTAQIECTFLDYNYDSLTAIISVGLFIFGILFCIFGKRI
jgi:hypothetical protein